VPGRGWTPEERRHRAADYSPSKTPRYYQLNAINRTVEAIARGRTACCWSWPPAPARPTPPSRSSGGCGSRAGAPKKRILFLADRNILIDQTMVNDFRPFKGAMAKLSPNAKGVEAGRQESYEIYLSLYQAVTGTEEERTSTSSSRPTSST
jgi:type I restriction enzyme R subunit